MTKKQMKQDSDIVIRRTAKYIRVSTDQQEANGQSLDVQEDKLNDYIASHDDLILAGTYLDGGISGQKLSQRGEITRLIEDVKNDKIDLIIFTRLDRWFRNLKHFLNIGEILEAHNCAWISIDQPYYETRTAYGRAFVNNSMIWAELEAQNDSDRIKEHNINRIKNGFVVTGHTSLGFKIENSRLVHDEMMPIAVGAIECFNRTHCIRDGLRYLTDHGVVMTINNFKASLLRNPKYIGSYRGNKEYCPRAISDEIFYENQNILSKNMTIRSGRTRDYIFSSLIECAHCGHNYGANLSGSGKYASKAYRCSYAHSMPSDCDNRSSISERKVETYLLNNIESELRKYITEYETKAKPAISNKGKIKVLVNKMERLKDLYLNELITLDELKNDRAILINQIAMLESEDVQPLRDITPLKDFLKRDFRTIYNDLSIKEKRSLWRSIIQKIIMDSDKNIRIIFL